MDTLSYKTISANKATVTKEWVIVDATDQTLGRLGAKVAKLLRGKYKPNFTPHVDCGDNVIIINADKVKLTGNKWNDRVYLSYTGYPGGQREMTPARLMAKPNGEDEITEKSSKGHACLRTSWELNCWAICMFTLVANTNTMLRTRK